MRDPRRLRCTGCEGVIRMVWIRARVVDIHPTGSHWATAATPGFLAARLLLERWQGLKSRDHALFEFGRLRNTR
jgi:hypothetical protein